MKPHLVIIPGLFNSDQLFVHLIEALSETFTVHFINLPGFVPTIKPLSHTTFIALGNYCEREIKKLDLPEYYLMGISLGFGIISAMELPQGCKGIIAMEPYLGREYLRLLGLPPYIFGAISNFFYHSQLYKLAWNNTIGFSLFKILGRLTIKEAKLILGLMDARTMFETIDLIAGTQARLKFHNKPHLLIYNPNDAEIKGKETFAVFQEKIPKLYVKKLTMKHFPKKLDKQYFATLIASCFTNEVKDFLFA